MFLLPVWEPHFHSHWGSHHSPERYIFWSRGLIKRIWGFSDQEALFCNQEARSRGFETLCDIVQSCLCVPGICHVETLVSDFQYQRIASALLPVGCCSVSPSALWLQDCSTPGFSVLRHLPELAQTHVHWIGEPSCALPSPSPPALNLSQHQGLFQWVDSLHQVAKILELQHQYFQWVFRVDFL